MNKFVNKYIIKNGVSDTKANYLWYSLGSGIFALSTLVMTILVSRAVGEQIGGMFSIGLSIAQIFMTAAIFEVRTYQVTDVKNEFSFADYLTFRILLCILAFGISIVYVNISGYSTFKSSVILLLCLYKIIEGLTDIFEGEFQKENRIDISGKSMFFRTLLAVLCLAVTLFITKNIIISLVIMNVIAVISLIVNNIIPVKYFAKISITSEVKKLGKIFIYCGPLAMSNFINTYIINSSKLAIDKTMSDEYQLYYSAVFMPNMVINLFSGIIFKPMQTSMAQSYNNGEIKKFSKVIFKMIGIIIGFTIICIIGAYLVGIPVLSLLYGVELKPYKMVLIVLLIAGGVNAINIILYYVLTVMRKQNIMVFFYSIVAVVSLLFINKITKMYELMGAAIGYLGLVALLMLLLTTYILILIGKKRGKGNE